MSDCMFMDDGTCRLKLFNGTPTEDDCASCSSYSGKDRGLGDKVHRVLKNTGVQGLVKKVTKNRDCGCGKRRARLNEAFPTKDKS